MSTERRFLKDLKPEHKSIQQVEMENNDLLEKADYQLEEIKPSLHDLIRRILEEKPDALIFLDKGARLFATPMLRRLHDIGMQKRPEILFYNDGGLKTAKYRKKEDFLNMVKRDFEKLRNKKIFFIDETFSSGTGAGAILKASQIAKINAQYFALTRDPFVSKYVADSEKDITDAIAAGTLHIYGNKTHVLFTKDASKLYIVDSHDDKKRYVTGTLGRYSVLKPDEVEKEFDYSSASRLNLRRAMNPKGAENWKEFDQKVIESNMRTVKTLKDKIYSALTSAT